MLKIKLTLQKGEYNQFSKTGINCFDLNEKANKELFKNTKIKMETIKDSYIPVIKSDIFISYSHDDEKEAILLSNELQRYGWNTFVDCLYWESIDKALKDYDDLYSKNNSSTTYSYRKRNKSTSTFHMILIDSIMDAIKNTKVFIMLNSSNYMGSSKRTISPWIYFETKIAGLSPNDYRTIKLRDSLKESISFPVNDKDYLTINSFDNLIEILNGYFCSKKMK